MTAALHRVYHRVELAANTPEPGLEAQPSIKWVSGGMDSNVRYETLTRQGQRHVNTFVRPEWIERVMGEPPKAHPIGSLSASTVRLLPKSVWLSL